MTFSILHTETKLEQDIHYHIHVPTNVDLFLELVHPSCDDFTKVVVTINRSDPVLLQKQDGKYIVKVPYTLNQLQHIQVKAFIFQTIIAQPSVFVQIERVCVCPCERCADCCVCRIEKKVEKKDYSGRLWWDDDIMDACVALE